MEKMKTESELLQASLAGSREAFGTIVEQYQSLICAITYSAMGDFGKSEELAQETFIRAWKELGQLKDLSKFQGWLCTIARNLVRKSIMSRQRDVLGDAKSLEKIEMAESTESEPSQSAISKEKEVIIWGALQQIPEQFREPMVLFYREQQSVSKVATELGLSEDATKQRLSRGRKLLKREIATLVEDVLGRTGPGKAFIIAVLATLPAVKANAVGTGTAAISATGFLSAKTTFWASLGSALLGTFIFLLTGGYLMLIGFVGFSAYLLLRRPSWYGSKKAKIWMSIIPCFLLALLWGLTGKLYWSLLFVLLGLGGLFALHPGCPEKVRVWLSGPDRSDPLYLWKRWDWQVPPKNWKSALCCFLSLMTAFIATGMYIIYKTTSHIAWGLVIMATLLALNFAVHSARLIVKVWSCYRRDKKD